MYESNNRNANFENLPFDDNEILIARKLLYSINDDIVFRFINGLSVHI